MIQIIVGHRGTGKTALSKKFSPIPVFDLDQQIKTVTGRDAAQWIQESSEAAFREVERAQLLHLMTEQSSKDVMIVLGAGFELDVFAWPQNIEYEIIFWKRPTDSWGRIFTDRPRLDPKVSPLEEYQERFERRELRFRAFADWILEWPEGEQLNESSNAKALLSNTGSMQSATYTIRSGDRERFDVLKNHFLRWNFQSFELRTDLLDAGELEFWRKRLPAERTLWAERQSAAILTEKPADAGFFTTDWALEWGDPPAKFQTLSNHGSDLSLFPVGSDFELKWSPLIESWSDLQKGFRWQQEDPQRRSFLPRSVSGRWNWFRLWMKGKQRLNFVREFPLPEAPDQPGFLEWMNTPLAAKSFAAILGDPVLHSWTPGEQAAYFVNFQMPVLRIHVEESEFDAALPVLKEFGMKAAAVTSPLKLKAFGACQIVTTMAQELESVNTLALVNGQWVGDNTDLAGLREAMKIEKLLHTEMPIQIYGGGGTLKMLTALFPEASRYSVRTQQLRPGSPDVAADGIFIWAAGPRDELPQFLTTPKVVVDLNYRQDSRAREFALKTGARYVGGEKMFLSQAALQRDFWSLYWKGFNL